MYLQTYFVFESKLTFTIFKWLFKVYNVYLQTFFLFESQRSRSRSKQCPSGVIYAQSLERHLVRTSSPSSSNPPSRSSAWSAWTCGLWANQWQCSSEEIFAQPLETTIVNKYTTLHKSFGLSDIVCCDLWLVINLKLATGMESEMV